MKLAPRRMLTVGFLRIWSYAFVKKSVMRTCKSMFPKKSIDTLEARQRRTLPAACRRTIPRSEKIDLAIKFDRASVSNNHSIGHSVWWCIPTDADTQKPDLLMIAIISFCFS